MGKKINAKKVAEDFNSGMHENSIMAKYGLSPGQMKQLKDKLEAAGLLHEQETQSGPSMGYTPNLYDDPYECPSCGFKQNDEFAECPRCGVIVSKMSKQEQAKAEQEKQKPVQLSEQLTSEAVMVKSGGPFKKIVFLLIICLGVAIYLVYFRGKEEPPQFVSPLNVEEGDDGVKRLGGEKAGKFRKMIENRAPNLAPLDESLDEGLNNELGDLGDAADDKYERFNEEADSQANEP